MSTLCIMRTWTVEFSPSVFNWVLAITSVTLACTLRHRSLVGQTTARKMITVTAARRGPLPRTQALLLGALRPSRRMENANAIRWGTLYNFRFDCDRPPQAANA